jgi:hypothetical protein
LQHPFSAFYFAKSNIKFNIRLIHKNDMSWPTVHNNQVGTAAERIRLWGPQHIRMAPDHKGFLICEEYDSSVGESDEPDSPGPMFINRVRYIGADGKLGQVYGRHEFHESWWPSSAAAGPGGCVLVADTRLCGVRCFSPDGKEQYQIIPRDKNQSTFRYVSNAVPLTDGKLLIAAEGTILLMSSCESDAQILSRCTIPKHERRSQSRFLLFTAVCHDPASGRIFGLCRVGNCVYVFEQDGTFLYRFGRHSEAYQLHFPQDMALVESESGSESLLVIANTWDRCIIVCNLDGKFVAVHQLAAETFPTSLVVTPRGTIVVCTDATNSIVELKPTDL